jgi:hypothetical protein
MVHLITDDQSLAELAGLQVAHRADRQHAGDGWQVIIDEMDG